MTTYTYAELLAAIDKARRDPEEWDGLMEGGWSVAAAHNAQLDLCQAILDLHTPLHDAYQEPNGGAWMDTCECCEDDWPCATVQVVADALTKMGVLP